MPLFLFIFIVLVLVINLVGGLYATDGNIASVCLAIFAMGVWLAIWFGWYSGMLL